MPWPSYIDGCYPLVGRPRYPELWENCHCAWCPSLGPTGLALFDMSGGEHHGTLTGMAAGTAWSINRGQYALQFDGTNDYIQLTKAPFDSTQILWTYSGWFYFDALAGSDSDPCLLNSGSTYLAVGSSSRMQFFAGTWKSFTGTVPTQQWVHLAWVRTGLSECTAYLNGASLGALSFNPGDMISSTQLMSRVDAPSLGLQGFADCLMIHSRPLSESRVRLLARRRGIAYETEEPAAYTAEQIAAFKAAWAYRQRMLIGGGVL